MRLRLLVPILVFAFSVSAETTENIPPTEEALRQAVTDRMNYLESVHGIMFDRAELCGVYFGIPDGENHIRAEYIPGDRAIYLNPKFALQFLVIQYYMGEHAFEGDTELNWDPELMTLLGHELGHAKADQTSRRIGNGAWPNLAMFSKLVWHKRYGVKILSEGIGGFFGHIAWAEGKRGEKSLPARSDDDYWHSDDGGDAFYDGGYWLVAPILRNFGEKGLEYLVTHPLEFPDGNARRAAKEYQKKALAELGKNVRK